MVIYIALSFALLLLAGLAVRIWLGYRNLTSEAVTDFEYKRDQKMLDADYGQAAYVRAYRRLHAPRGAAYVLGILLACAALTFPMLGIMTFLFEYGWRLGGQDRTFEPGYLVWQFMLLAGLIIGWAMIAWYGARRYYRKSPGTMKDELETAKRELGA